MKKVISIILLVLILSLPACSTPDIPLTDVENTSDTQSENITMLDAGVWPANDFTEGLPVPSGTVAWAMLDNQHDNCSISITDMRETEYTDYLDLLKQTGFSMVTDASEEPKGQDYVSIGTLLSDGERWLSISYIPNRFTIYISWKQ